MIYSVKLTEKNRFIALHSVKLSLQMREIYRKKGGTVVPPSDFQSEGPLTHKNPPHKHRHFQTFLTRTRTHVTHVRLRVPLPLLRS